MTENSIEMMEVTEMTAVPDENVTTAISKDGDAEEGEDEDFEAEADDLGGNGGGDDDGGEARRVPATATAGDIPPPSLSRLRLGQGGRPAARQTLLELQELIEALIEGRPFPVASTLHARVHRASPRG